MRHYLAIDEFSPQEIEELLDLAIDLKREYRKSGNKPLLAKKTLAMVFQKPSLRTRVSFDMAMRHLGGDALYLSPNEIGLGKRESIADVSRVLSGYVDAVMARVFDHAHVLELAEYSSVPVINGLSDFNHPCQALADSLTIKEHFNKLEGLNVTYIGDGNNVAVSLLFACSRLGMNFTLSAPEGYEIPSDTWKHGVEMGEETGAKHRIESDPHKAVIDAQVIYTDTWVSMGQEEEAAKREKLFPPYQVNSALVAEADDSVIVMHCLPAHRGQEITNEVADGPHSVLFPQAENRMHAQKAILVKLLTG
jgi:ornithine carbamoyltransferase